MKKEHDLNPVMEPAANDSKTAFHVMTKPIGPLCNLDCTYCFYLEKENLYPQAQKRASWSMQDDVLETYIRQYIASQDTPVVSFAWQGGEPTLLGVEYFRKVVALQKEYADGRKVENAFQTNGVILDDTWCAFFAEHNFLIGLSIDGPRALHDKYRVDKGGQPTFDRVIQGLSYLKKHDVAFNTLTVVQRHNGDYPLEVYRFLKEIGSGFMQFIPIVERVATEPGLDHLSLVAPDFTSEAVVSEWSVEPEQYGRFLCTIFDEWVRNDVGQYFVQLFDVALESWIGKQPGLCVFRETCGDALALEHNGDLYSCDHFVYPANKLGNIMDKPLLSMTHSFQQQSFGAAKQDTLPDYCRRCDVRFACNGECPKKRFMKTPDGEAGLNYLCAGYKMFFKHIDPYMRFMAGQLYQRRAPADVMAWSRWQDFHASGGRIGRNKPCPCGSGRKYKVCCGTLRNGGGQLAGSA